MNFFSSLGIFFTTLGHQLTNPNVFNILSWVVVILCGLAAATTVDRKCWIPHWLYQVSFILIGFALAWGTVYGDDRQWEPWPPHLLLIAALGFFLALRVIRYSVMFKSVRGHLPLLVDGKIDPKELLRKL